MSRSGLEERQLELSFSKRTWIKLASWRHGHKPPKPRSIRLGCSDCYRSSSSLPEVSFLDLFVRCNRNYILISIKLDKHHSPRNLVLYTHNLHRIPANTQCQQMFQSLNGLFSMIRAEDRFVKHATKYKINDIIKQLHIVFGRTRRDAGTFR